MNTCLCDVHVKFIKNNKFCKYNNLKDWCSDSNNVYIGRCNILTIDGKRYPEESSIWANPFIPENNSEIEKVLNQYCDYITKKIIKENLFDELKKLKGKKLGCWCIGSNIVTVTNPKNTDIPWICHGQILLYLINFYFP